MFSTFDFLLPSLHLWGVNYKILYTCLLWVLVSCQTDPSSRPAPLYFDLPAYLLKERNRQAIAVKTATVIWEKDGISEVKTNQPLNWEEAFKAWKKLDLNKTAYRGLFRCDTLAEQDDLLWVRYEATDLAVKPASLELLYRGTVVVRLEVKETEKNLLYQSAATYTYVPDDTLRISGTQEVIFGKKHSYSRSWLY